MSDDTQALKSFLISLGFKIDQDAFSKFNKTTAFSTNTVVRLGEAVVAATTSMELFVKGMTEQFTNLYYASQRTGATVSQIQSMGFAFKQAGLSSTTAKEAIENMARSLRNNPAMIGLLQQLAYPKGIPAGKTPADMFKDLASALKSMPLYEANQFASMFGADPDTLFNYLSNQKVIQEQEDIFNQKLKEAGINSQHLAEQSKDFTQDWNDFTANVNVTAQVLASKLIPSADGFLKKTSEWLTSFDSFINDTAPHISLFLDHWSTAMDKIFNFLGGGKSKEQGAIPWGANDKSSLAQYDPINWLERRMAIAFGYGTGEQLPGTPDIGGSKATPSATNPSGIPGVTAPIGGMQGTMGGSGGRGSAGSAMDFFTAMGGWTKEQAAAIVGNLLAESGLDPKIHESGAGRGIAQWTDPSRLAGFKSMFGHDVDQGSFAEQLQYVQYELTKGAYRAVGDALRATNTVAGGTGLMLGKFENPKVQDLAEFSRRLSLSNQALTSTPGGAGVPVALGSSGVSSSVTLQQKTDIHVAAGPTAHETATRVADAQKDTTVNALRYTKSAVN